MIGVNDGGFIPNPGTRGIRGYPVRVTTDDATEDRAEGDTQLPITDEYIQMLEEIWIMTGHGKAKE